MNAEMLARVRSVACGEHSAVTPDDGVTVTSWLRPKTPELRWLRQLRPKWDEGENKNAEARPRATANCWTPTLARNAPASASDRVPPVYLDAWARLNCQKPATLSEAEWAARPRWRRFPSRGSVPKPRACAGRAASYSTWRARLIWPAGGRESRRHRRGLIERLRDD